MKLQCLRRKVYVIAETISDGCKQGKLFCLLMKFWTGIAKVKIPLLESRCQKQVKLLC